MPYYDTLYTLSGVFIEIIIIIIIIIIATIFPTWRRNFLGNTVASNLVTANGVENNRVG